MPKPFRPDLRDTRDATKEVAFMYFLRGAIQEFTTRTPLTPAELTWGLAFLTGSAIGQPRMLQELGDLSPKRLRDYAVAVLDDGIDNAQAGTSKVILPN